MEIAFTAGRKENGLTAEMQIEDSGDIPGYTDYVAPAVLRAVPVDLRTSPAVAAIATPETEAERAKPAPLAFEGGEPVIPKETAPAAVKAVSLFT